MFNHYFFSGTWSEDIFKKFITEDSGKRVAMVIDPPFGGMVEALASTVSKIEQQWQLNSSGIVVFVLLATSRSEISVSN